jgi:hypothetical protein
VNGNTPQPAREFVSEPILPAAGSFDAAAMSRGEPGMPKSFSWREKEYVVAHVRSTWKSTGKDRGEVYLRRHWFDVETETGQRMTIYCERQAKNLNKPTARWWLYSMERAG